LEFITSTDSVYYNDNKNEVKFALDKLVENRNKDGVWDIPWGWYMI
jgi:hypothetical protein